MTAAIAAAPQTWAAPAWGAQAPASNAAPNASSPNASSPDAAGLVAAAIADAQRSLGDDIRSRPIPNSNLTVDEFLTQTAAADEFARAIHKAEQIGGPRWIDETTCQVRFDLAGDRIAAVLVKIAEDHADRSPLKSEALAHNLDGWKAMRFSATGTSARADRISALSPGAVGPNPAWRNVPDAVRQRAIDDARADAVKRILKSVASVSVGQKTAGDIIQDADPVRVALEKWLGEQPVSNIQFRDDLRVSYTLSASGTQLFDQFMVAARNAKIPIALDQQAFVAARGDFAQHVLPTTGTNEGGPLVLQQGAPAPVVPAQAPDWVFGQIEGSGEAKFSGSQLRTKQEAEDRAADAIANKLLALPLNKNETVKEAMRRDPMVRDAVNRAVSRASLSKVAFNADGSVSVKMVLPGQFFWDALTSP